MTGRPSSRAQTCKHSCRARGIGRLRDRDRSSENVTGVPSRIRSTTSLGSPCQTGRNSHSPGTTTGARDSGSAEQPCRDGLAISTFAVDPARKAHVQRLHPGPGRDMPGNRHPVRSSRAPTAMTKQHPRTTQVLRAGARFIEMELATDSREMTWITRPGGLRRCIRRMPRHRPLTGSVAPSYRDTEIRPPFQCPPSCPRRAPLKPARARTRRPSPRPARTRRAS
jgi:hypothetical protein